MQVQYGIKEIALGYLLLGQTSEGLCAALLASSEKAALNELKQYYSTASLVEDNVALSDWFVCFERLLMGEALNSEGKLQLIGTEFQQTVWLALLDIPFGEVWTYTQLAEYIGKPKAFRAVASACAKNKLAIVVPCHRVISKSGGLGGYRWGLERKQQLLDAEKSACKLSNS